MTAGPIGLTPPATGVARRRDADRSSATIEHSRRRKILTFAAFVVGVLVVLGGPEGSGRRSVAHHGWPRDRRHLRAPAALPLGVRERSRPAPLVQHPCGAGPAGADRDRDVARAVPRRRRLLHVARGVHRVPRRGRAGPGPRHDLRPLAAARAGCGAVRRRQPDDPDHRPRADDRVRLRAERVLGRGDRRVPDLLPGHDRDDPRPALTRPAGARADAFVRGDPLGDLSQGAPARIPAVPLHRLEDRRDGVHRRRHHRRGAGGIPDGLGRAILDFNQYYITAPERLWGSIVVSALLGISFYALLSLAEWLVLRGRRPAR